MPWNLKSLIDYRSLDDVPDWLIELRKEQAEFQRKLKATRDAKAAWIFESELLPELAGPGPWPFAALYSKWRLLDTGLPESAYRSTWVKRQLLAAGFSVSGKRERIRQSYREKTGLKRWRTIGQEDKRQIERVTKMGSDGPELSI